MSKVNKLRKEVRQLILSRLGSIDGRSLKKYFEITETGRSDKLQQLKELLAGSVEKGQRLSKKDIKKVEYKPKKVKRTVAPAAPVQFVKVFVKCNVNILQYRSGGKTKRSPKKLN